MRESGHVASYYAATAHRQDARPALRGAEQADICIIGAGYTGISAALELAERGFSVIVLEAVRVGFGASGRNGGQIVNGYSRPLDVIAARYGEPAGRAIGAMALEGAKIIRKRVDRYAIACDLVPGGLLVALSPKQMQWLEHEQHIWARHGHPGLELLDHTGLAPHVASARYVGGLLDPLGGH
jgi:gamma-glutamylputrescine oxidase